jgi:hypothetical protein
MEFSVVVSRPVSKPGPTGYAASALLAALGRCKFQYDWPAQCLLSVCNKQEPAVPHVGAATDRLLDFKGRGKIFHVLN